MKGLVVGAAVDVDGGKVFPDSGSGESDDAGGFRRRASRLLLRSKHVEIFQIEEAESLAPLPARRTRRHLLLDPSFAGAG